jgi:chromosome partitioning protein
VKVLALAGHKGGGSKTTLAVNLAAAWAAEGQRVLVVDLDPQASASRWLGAPAEAGTSADVLAGLLSAAEVLRPSMVAGLAVLPASPAMAAAAAALPPDAVLALRPALETLRADVAVIDCPPSLGVLALAALYAADLAILPTAPSGLDLDALADSLAMVERVQGRRSGAPALRVVASRVDDRLTLARATLERLRQRLPAALMGTVIRERVAHREAATLRRPVAEIEPAGDAAADVRSLAAETWRLLHG